MRARGLLVIAITLGVLSPVSSATPAEDTGVDFAVTPSQLELTAEPGGTDYATLRVYNQVDVPLDLELYVRDVELPSDDLIGDADVAFSAADWIRFVDPTVHIPGKRSVDVPLVVGVPAGAATGGYHAFGFLQSGTSNLGVEGVQVSGRIGVTLLLNVTSPGFAFTRMARLSEFDVTVAWSGLFDADVITSTTLENQGDTHVLVGGLHTYRAWPGSETSRVKVGPHTLLRRTRYTLSSSFTGVPWFGRVTVTSELVYQRGPDDLPAIVVQRTIWIIPWRLVALVLVLVLTLAGARSFVRRRRSANRRPVASGFGRSTAPSPAAATGRASVLPRRKR